MRLPAVIGISLVSLIAVWYVAIAPRVDLGASRVALGEAQQRLTDLELKLQSVEATLVVERAESAKATLLILKTEADRAAASEALQAIEARYSNYEPKDKEDEATKCLYLKPPADLRRVLRQD